MRVSRPDIYELTRPGYSRGTDPIENAAFPLLRSRLGSDDIENMSRVVCLATVINKRFHCLLLTYRVHVTLLPP
jgi:hypothetical protein